MSTPEEHPEAVADVGHRPRKGRSPAYPGIPLDVAIERARAVYDQERRHAAPISAILAHWGYGPKSSGGFSTLAALKQYGLLEDEGSGTRRKARLTPLAFAILLDEREDSAARLESIREAALYPGIHRELWEQFGPALPSEASLRTHLLMDLDFTESGVKDFLPVFRRTIEYAGLLRDELESDRPYEPAAVEPERHADRDGGHRGLRNAPVDHDDREAQRTSKERVVVIPVTPSTWVTFRGDFPLEETAWNQMMTILEAMKPGLTEAAFDEE